MLTRIITGIIGILIAAVVIMAGGALFAAFALVLALGAYVEYVRAFRHAGRSLLLGAGLFSLVLIVGAGAYGELRCLVGAVMVSTLLLLLVAVLRFGRVSFTEAALSLAGVLYIGLPFAHMVLLRSLGADVVLTTPVTDFSLGCALVWVMFLSTWSSDTFAYFTGSAVGRHRLAPAISPHKTVEGLIGALVGTTVVGAALGCFFSLPVPALAAIGFFLALFAVLGDLVESALKRETGIKDSGSIIPGHGGVLDRFDSCLFTAPVLYYIVLFSGILAR